jgi:hypothetical protein
MPVDCLSKTPLCFSGLVVIGSYSPSPAGDGEWMGGGLKIYTCLVDSCLLVSTAELPCIRGKNIGVGK